MDPIYSVTCFTRALVSPGYTPEQDERWLDCVWGHYTSQKCAELAIFREILDDPDHGNYKVLYEEDIPRLDEEGESDHAWGDFDRELMRVVITIKDHGIPVMETRVCLMKTEPIPESHFENDYPEVFQPVDEEWEERIEDYYTNGPPSSWQVKLTNEQIRSRSMENYGNTIAMGITKPEQWIYSHQYGWVMKDSVDTYEFTTKYAEGIKLVGEKNLESECFRQFNRENREYLLSQNKTTKSDWIYITKYGWLLKAHIEEIHFKTKYAEEIAKFGAKTPEAKGEAAAMRRYEIERDISDENDWVYTSEYGWFKKEWATEEPTDKESDEIEHTTMFADWEQV